MADLPGLIEGASEGAGLGHRFLGHLERCAAIFHLVDATEPDVVANWRIIRGELEAYGNGLEHKVEIIGLNKTDAVPAEELADKRRRLKRASKHEVLTLSGATGAGIQAAMTKLLTQVNLVRAEQRPIEPVEP